MLADVIKDHLGEDAASLITRLALVIALLLLTWLLRQIITAVIPRVVRRLLRRTPITWDQPLIEALQPPARFLVTVIGLWSAVLALEPPRAVRDALSPVANSLIAIGLFWGIYRLVGPAVDMFLMLSRRTVRPAVAPSLLDARLAPVIKQIGGALIVVLGAAAVIGSWGYDVAGLVAGLGIGGLAVALAAQDTLANLFGYFVVLADEPFQIGDYVIFEGVKGSVEALGFRSTRIRAPDQSLITVPNSTVMKASITNWSRLSKRRLDMTLGITYDSSPQQVLSVVQAIREMLRAHELIERDSVVVQFVAFSDSSLDIMIICFINTPAWADFQAARQDINLKIMGLLAERGVAVAFPSRTVLVQPASVPDAAALAAVLPAPQPEPPISTVKDSPVPDDAAN
ncbi:MAG: mechanosensitive ion channel family protein [Anaerolineae bacterium]|nr:mechanosensitive ion channel family protein [Anaerolineae bacterium]